MRGKTDYLGGQQILLLIIHEQDFMTRKITS